jgi:hypothetical protein
MTLSCSTYNFKLDMDSRQEDEEEDVGSYWMTLRKGGSSRSHSLESSLWKRLWTCRKADY